MAHGDDAPEYRANRCPICGGRHDAGSAEAIVTMAVKEVVLGDRTPEWFRSKAESLYDGKHNLRLIARVTERLEQLGGEKQGVTA